MSLDRVRLCYPEQGDELWVGGKTVWKRRGAKATAAASRTSDRPSKEGPTMACQN